MWSDSVIDFHDFINLFEGADQLQKVGAENYKQYLLM